MSDERVNVNKASEELIEIMEIMHAQLGRDPADLDTIRRIDMPFKQWMLVFLALGQSIMYLHGHDPASAPFHIKRDPNTKRLYVHD